MSDKTIKFLEGRRDALGEPLLDDEARALKERVFPLLNGPGAKPLFAAMLADPDNHEDLMRELIEYQKITEPQPFDVFRATVRLGIDLLMATVAGSLREKDADAAMQLVEQATALAHKIKDQHLEEYLWLKFDEMAREAGLADEEFCRVIVLRVGEALEKYDRASEAADAFGVLLDISSGPELAGTRLNLKIRVADQFRKSDRAEEAEKMLEDVINEADDAKEPGIAAKAWLSLARAKNAGNDVRETVRYYGNTIQAAEDALGLDVFIAASDELGRIFAQIGAFEDSWECLKKAQNVAMGANDIGAQVQLIKTAWPACENLRKWGDYLIMLRTTRHYVVGNDIIDLLGTVLEYMGRIHVAMGNKEEAAKYLDEATSAYQAVNDETGLAAIAEIITGQSDAPA